MKAILNIADTGALESTAYMLECAGYDCYRPNNELIKELRHFGLENVLSVEDLVADYGYAPPRVSKLASPQDMFHADLFVDTKAHVNYETIVKCWNNLRGKVAWMCLNGGDPWKRRDGLRWTNPPCPVITHNQWYKPFGKAYVCYPPYMRFGEQPQSNENADGNPICLVHNVERWGYGHAVQPLREIGVKFYGLNTPEGPIKNGNALELLAKAVAMVYLKQGDTVGYATLEAISVGTPLMVTQHYIDETNLHDLLKPGWTCVVFNQLNAVESVQHLLRIFRENKPFRDSIVAQARANLLAVMWNKERDLRSFKRFMERNFK